MDPLYYEDVTPHQVLLSTQLPALVAPHVL